MRKFRQSPEQFYFRHFHFKGVDAPSAPAQPAPAPPPSSPTRETARDVQQAKADEKQREKAKRGYQSTVLNGADGLGGSAFGAQKQTVLEGWNSGR